MAKCKDGSIIKMEGYSPNDLLDVVATILDAETDAKLAEGIGISPASISKMRHKVVGIGPQTIVLIHEITGMPIQKIKGLMMGGSNESRQ